MADLTAVVENTLNTGPLSLSAQLYPNLESFPGQLMVTPPRMSAAQEGKIARRDAVRRGRQVERTSSHIWGGLDRKADMVVGGRLLVHPTPDFELLGITDRDQRRDIVRQMQRAFNAWAYDSRNLCDAEGNDDFGGLIWRAFRGLEGPDAEVAGIIHYDRDRRAEYRTPWATFVTLLDPDRIETPPEHVGDENVHEGKRLDRHGRMLGFYCRKRHPAESGADANTYEYVERETWWGRQIGFHWFRKTRGGQQRGLTRLITILRQSTMLDKFDDAQLGAAVIAAIVQTYIKTTASNETMAEQLAPGKNGASVVDMKLDYYGKAKFRVGQQRIPLLAPNDEIVMESVQRAIPDPSAFRMGFLREFGIAIGITGEQISNDFSDTNYSAARAALLDVWRGVLTDRRLFTQAVPSPMFAAVIEEAIELGMVILPAGAPAFQENRAAWSACRWTGPGMGWIDPLKEANAMLVRLQSKTRSIQQEIASNGEDWLDVFDEIEQAELEAEDRGIDLSVKPSAAALPADGGAEEAAPSKTKKKGAVSGDGDGDGVANEEPK